MNETAKYNLNVSMTDQMNTKIRVWKVAATRKLYPMVNSDYISKFRKETMHYMHR